MDRTRQRRRVSDDLHGKMLYIALYMASIRTQIYLTEDQRDRLDELAEREGKSLAALIRAAVDEYLIRSAPDPGKGARRDLWQRSEFRGPASK